MKQFQLFPDQKNSSLVATETIKVICKMTTLTVTGAERLGAPVGIASGSVSASEDRPQKQETVTRTFVFNK